jgi:hypothetical protein
MRKPTNSGAPPSFAALAQTFFADYLTQQRALSPRTVATYRDAFVLFLNFAERKLQKPPTAIKLTEITPTLILSIIMYRTQVREKAQLRDNSRICNRTTIHNFELCIMAVNRRWAKASKYSQKSNQMPDSGHTCSSPNCGMYGTKAAQRYRKR